MGLFGIVCAQKQWQKWTGLCM